MSAEWHIAEKAIPLAIMGYSFGCNIAYECAKCLEENGVNNLAHLIFIAGASFERVSRYPVNRDDYDVHDITELERRFFESLEESFGYIPNYLNKNHAQYHESMKNYSLQGNQAI